MDNNLIYVIKQENCKKLQLVRSGLNKLFIQHCDGYDLEFTITIINFFGRLYHIIHTNDQPPGISISSDIEYIIDSLMNASDNFILHLSYLTDKHLIPIKSIVISYDNNEYNSIELARQFLQSIIGG